MMYKWIGATLVVFGCTSVGVVMAIHVKAEIAALKSLALSLEYIINELSCRLTSLPQLCRNASERSGDCVSRFFSVLSEELEGQVAPDVRSCVDVAVYKTPKLPEQTRQLLLELGTTLGKFDLDGQIASLRCLKAECEDACSRLKNDKEQRLNNYKTLGVCTGAALAILLL